MSRTNTVDPPGFQALDDSLEALFASEIELVSPQYDRRPATLLVTRLFYGVATSIRHCARNRHKLYRISLRSHHILRQVHDIAAEIESSTTEPSDDRTLALFDSFTQSITSFET